MRIISSVATVIGEPQPNCWAQTLNDPLGYAVVEVRGAEPIARNTGIDILSEITDALNSHPVSLNEVQRIVDMAFGDEVNSLIVMVPVGNIVYIAALGSGRVYLKRSNQLAVLVEGEGKISGEIRTGDLLLLTTPGLSEVLPQHQMINSLDHLSPTAAAEKLTLLIHQSQKANSGALLIYEAAGFSDEEVRIADPVYPARSARKWSLPVFPSKRDFTRELLQIRSGKFNFPKISAGISGLSIKKKLPAFLIAGIAIILFIVSVVIGINSQNTKKQLSAAEVAVNQAQHAYDEGMALRDLNPLKAREKLNEAKNILGPVVNIPQKKPDKKAADLYQQISDNLVLTLQITDVTPSLYFDAGLLKSGAITGGMALAGDELGLLDKQNKSAFLLKIPGKSGSVLGGGDFIGPDALIMVGDRSVYVYSGDAINELTFDGKGVKKTVIKNDNAWGKIASMTGFGGNIYLLDSLKNRIWKYTGTGSGFSDRKEYLGTDTTVNFSDVTNFAVDGSVWVATRTGKILKFTQGTAQPFATQGVDPVFGQELYIYTNDEIEHLYVLDPENSRVVVLDKTGLYVAQYVWKNRIAVSGFAVSEPQKKIFLLSAGQIMAFDIK
jgi:hypothetical protein